MAGMLSLPYGAEHIDINLDACSLVPVTRQAPVTSAADPKIALWEALEKPLGFPPLRPRLDAGRSHRPGGGRTSPATGRTFDADSGTHRQRRRGAVRHHSSNRRHHRSSALGRRFARSIRGRTPGDPQSQGSQKTELPGHDPSRTTPVPQSHCGGCRSAGSAVPAGHRFPADARRGETSLSGSRRRGGPSEPAEPIGQHPLPSTGGHGSGLVAGSAVPGADHRGSGG